MLVWLIHHFSPFLERLELLSSGDSTVFLTVRTALASLTAFLLCILLGPIAIRQLRKRFPERVDSASERLNELQAGKNTTPTMGGLLIIGVIVLSILMWGDPASRYVQLALLTALGFAGLGAYDDWVKLSTRRNGLTVRRKLLVQLILAAIIGTGLYFEQNTKPGGTDFVWPLGGFALPLGIGFIAWSMLVTVGSSNAVNLTDGLDGLATGCLIFAGSALVALTYLAGHSIMASYLSIPFISGCGELCIVMGALVGAMLGFLWFNCYPAQVFMGDAGSLPLGALLALAALATRQEVLLVLIGGVFVIETLSVILQVGWFRMTGRRLIACSPLHNHFLFRGDHEIKIVVRFW
ncbi:MAG: phospho-N-acetylmuramoyl-pentapeptide-transferase, partial [Planctomycetaceae bacterium]|nr:phospho-N-acetylmuramoyl-pentapeptide-transferase [Planctomycetaceae bacterium]